MSPLTTPLPSWPAAQISSPKNEVVITNDGATILKQMQVAHPTAKMLVDLSKSQDVEAGDGTTTVTVIAGSLLNQAQILLEKIVAPLLKRAAENFEAKRLEEALADVERAAEAGGKRPDVIELRDRILAALRQDTRIDYQIFRTILL